MFVQNVESERPTGATGKPILRHLCERNLGHPLGGVCPLQIGSSIGREDMIALTKIKIPEPIRGSPRQGFFPSLKKRKKERLREKPRRWDPLGLGCRGPLPGAKLMSGAVNARLRTTLGEAVQVGGSLQTARP